MKKLLYTLLLTTLLSMCVFADEQTDVLKVFNKYVADANSYSKTLPDYYVQNAKIIRVVNKKQGGQQSVIIPFDRYLKELSGHSVLAKTVGYKNRYVNQKITKTKDGYKVSATRIPRNDKTGLASYFIFVKQGNDWKIKEESMTTNVQTFLNAK